MSSIKAMPPVYKSRASLTSAPPRSVRM
jgi:hypothetical protein